MQDCFRQYPDVYGAELADDEEEGETTAPAPEAAEAAPTKQASEESAAAKPTTESATTAEKSIPSSSEKHDEEVKEPGEEVPKAAFDATSANKGKEQK